MIKILTPGSCGELIQGFYGGKEMLISYPVNIFSEVIIKSGKFSHKKINAKSFMAIKEFFRYFDIQLNEMNNIDVSIRTDIPYGKGMASSTADIAGVFFGLSKYFKIQLDANILAKLCTAVEPTDSIIFKKISLFDHINGELIENFDWNLDFSVIVLEPPYEVNTIDFRKSKIRQLENKNHNSYVLHKFKQAYMDKSYYKLGEATIESAFENQGILEKPYIEKIIKVIEKNNCYGLNVAHSGSVIGIMYDKKKSDYEKIISGLKEEGILDYYNRQYILDVVEGGPKIVIE